MIRQAVILAAGNGSRLRKCERDLPKPLWNVGGISLIKRAILTARGAGIQEVVVVVGFEGDQIISALSKDPALGVTLKFVKNEEWKKGNGVSLLCARHHVRDRFLLMMADHLYETKALIKLMEAPTDALEVILGIDKNLIGIFDVEDATKVRTGDGWVREIGKGLMPFDAYDTGLFVCGATLFEVFEKIYRSRGDVTLSEGIAMLAQSNRVGTCDLTHTCWEDIDTPEALRHGEDKLFRQLGKPSDGWISRHLNRKISIFFSRIFLKIGLSANHVTGLVTLLGILSGILVARGHYTGVMLGGILFNLASILDGCDGEMARLTLSANRRGEWLDTLSDCATYLVFFLGVALGAYQQNPTPIVALEGTLMLVGFALALGFMFFYLIRYTHSGSLITVQRDLTEEADKAQNGKTSACLGKFTFLFRRDFFAFLLMVLAVFNQLQVMLFLIFIGAHLVWMVLAYKKQIFGFDKPEALEANQ